MYPRTYYPQYVSNADQLYCYCREHLDWQKYTIRMFGAQILQPRLVAYYASIWTNYRYSQTQLIWHGRDDQLYLIADTINTDYNLKLNSVLCNLYRDGQDSMWRHRDNESELWSDPIIASLTLWQARMFKMRNIVSQEVVSLTLDHGSLLLMWSGSQSDREHSLPKTTRTISPRINCTFRTITH